MLWHTQVEGETPAQVGALLGMAPGAVSSLAFRAREGLREAYLQAHLAETAAEQCRTTVERLGAWTRGGLSKREKAQVDAHLETCDRCRALAAELEEVNHGLRGLLAPLLLGGAAAGYLATLGPVAPLAAPGTLIAGAGSTGAAGAGAGGSGAGGSGAGGRRWRLGLRRWRRGSGRGRRRRRGSGRRGRGRLRRGNRCRSRGGSRRRGGRRHRSGCVGLGRFVRRRIGSRSWSRFGRGGSAGGAAGRSARSGRCGRPLVPPAQAQARVPVRVRAPAAGAGGIFAGLGVGGLVAAGAALVVAAVAAVVFIVNGNSPTPPTRLVRTSARASWRRATPPARRPGPTRARPAVFPSPIRAPPGALPAPAPRCRSFPEWIPARRAPPMVR